MKNGKMILVGGIAIVLIVCAVFMFGGSHDTGTTTILGSDYDKAQAALKNGEPEKAIELLKKFTAENPKDAKGWVLLGDAYRSIETFEQPMGDVNNALIAYYEGWNLKDTKATQRLAWGLSMFGRQEGDVHLQEYRNRLLEEYKAKQDKLNDTEKSIELEKIDFFDEVVEVPSCFTMWFSLLKSQLEKDNNDNILFATELVMQACLSNKIETQMGKYYFSSQIPPYLLSYIKIKEVVAQELKKGNNIAWTLDTLFAKENNIFAFRQLEKDVLQKLESNIDKLDNIGKSILLKQYYWCLFDPDYELWIKDRIPTIIQLAKDASKGPYTDTKIATEIMSKIELPQEEQNKVFDAVKNARYSESGKTWNDVVKKMESVTWTDYREQYSEDWIVRGVLCDGKYEGKALTIFFPVRYNTLKDRWELIMGRGGIQVYAEGRDDFIRIENLVPRAMGNTRESDHLTPWMEEILGIKGIGDKE